MNYMTLDTIGDFLKMMMSIPGQASMWHTEEDDDDPTQS